MKMVAAETKRAGVGAQSNNGKGEWIIKFFTKK